MTEARLNKWSNSLLICLITADWCCCCCCDFFRAKQSKTRGIFLEQLVLLTRTALSLSLCTLLIAVAFYLSFFRDSELSCVYKQIWSCCEISWGGEEEECDSESLSLKLREREREREDGRRVRRRRRRGDRREGGAVRGEDHRILHPRLHRRLLRRVTLRLRSWSLQLSILHLSSCVFLLVMFICSVLGIYIFFSCPWKICSEVLRFLSLNFLNFLSKSLVHYHWTSIERIISKFEKGKLAAWIILFEVLLIVSIEGKWWLKKNSLSRQKGVC